MAFIRNCIITAVLLFCIQHTKGQNMYYPVQSSQLLKATAEDMKALLQRAVKNSSFTLQTYTFLPESGIVFQYDSSITDNQACKVKSIANNLLQFSAAQDNGLCFGIYQYLQLLGFRFYQPGSIWEVIPDITTGIKQVDTTFSCAYKYKTWYVSGGHSRWAMDTTNTYYWDSYYGDIGHNWALYQRRNGMLGGYGFTGHRGDILSGDYMDAIKQNPCYIADYQGERTANSHSVPDINNTAAMQLWQQTIQDKYTKYVNAVTNYNSIYTDLYRNLNYYNKNIGIEVPDGAQWGNSTENDICNGKGYPKPSDQQFTLANFTAQKINTVYPCKHFQAYAYSSHADIPSASININEHIDIQLIPGAFQTETSAGALRSRWYKRSKNLSEYQYLNLPQWSGETPGFYLNDLKATLQIANDRHSQGIVWEASPAKFASLPFLLAANNYLKNTTAVDSTLQQFCNSMFAGAANTIFNLLNMWADDKTVGPAPTNKYKVPLFIKAINDADAQTTNAPVVVKERIRELKAYLHYMVLYYDWAGDQRSADAKAGKAAALCMYLAKTDKLQLVNSFFLIQNIVLQYAATSNFYTQYNVANGTAYQRGALPVITAAEIDADYRADAAQNMVDQYNLLSASDIQQQFSQGNINPVKRIRVKLGYTNGADYYNRSEFFIKATAAGTFIINYTPHFDMPDKGYINFAVESTDRSLDVLTDFSLDRTAATGALTITIPSAGNYKLTVSAKYKSAVDLDITTNGNYFYKKGVFFGSATENYRPDMLSFPGYFYVPANISKVYFSIGNSNPGGAGFATAASISESFVIKDNNGNTILSKLVTPKDSALFYLEVPAANRNTFWQVSKMEQYSLYFSNISNVQWFAERKPCSNADFTISMVRKNGVCTTRLTAAKNTGTLKWSVYDNASRWFTYSGQQVVDLPDYISPNSIITLVNGNGCMVSKRLSDDTKYLQAKQLCASGAALPVDTVAATAQAAAPMLIKAAIYPNPGNAVFNFMQNSTATIADDIAILNIQGSIVARFKNVKNFNINALAAGTYWYRIMVKGVEFKGSLVKI